MFLYSPTAINENIRSAGVGVENLLDNKYSSKIYGVILRDSPMKIYPTNDKKLSPEGFDLNCETLCRCCEPVVFLESAPHKDFYKVQTVYSSGYIHKNYVAAITLSDAEMLISSQRKLFITDKFVLTNPSPFERVSKIPLSFGSKIPFSKKDTNYNILLPYADKNGNALWESASLSPCPAIHEGPLKFTRKNILSLSLRMRGMPYDWGESFGGCDCSSLIRSAFSLCGINLPRNSGDISRITFKSIPFNRGTNTLNLCKPGDIICGEGHVMLYYGKKNNVHYVFHSFYGTRGITDITPVTEPTGEGTPLYEKFKKIIPLNSFKA